GLESMRGIPMSVRAACAIAVVIIAMGCGFPRPNRAQTPTPPPGGPCCRAHAGPGCDDVACNDCVCNSDPFCCFAQWDQSCAETQTIIRCSDECGCSTTPGPTPTPGGPCCSARDPEGGRPGCDDDICQTCVCGMDPMCCTNIWDTDCVLTAREECLTSCPCMALPTERPAATPTPGGDCCEAHEGPSCDDSECRACVCATDVDPECCTGVWDSRCVEEAGVDCALHCPCPAPFDCCAAHAPDVSCDDVRCKTCVCAQDQGAACCTPDLGWDADCVSMANVECAAECTCETPGGCCEAHVDTVGCDTMAGEDVDLRLCQDCVCNIDPACCAMGWDQRCAEEAGSSACKVRCAGCQACCEFDAENENQAPGCVNNDCEACVCAPGLDPACCTGVWDSQCVDEANNQCGSRCQCQAVSRCPGDCGDSSEVGINELIICVNISLGSAAADTCSACDVDGDGEVEVNELILPRNPSLT